MIYDSDEMCNFLQTIKNDNELDRRLGIVQSQIRMASQNKQYDALERLQDHERLIMERRLDLLNGGKNV